MKNLIDDLILKCENCGRIRELVEFYDVPDSQKKAVRKMMDEVGTELLDDEIERFIAFCKKCNEYSIVIVGGGGEWL